MIRFDSIHEMLDKASQLSESKAWKLATDRETRKFIISMNTHEQLGEEGIDSKGRDLGDYAPTTVQFRRSKGLQVAHIDFKVTGDYWRSWKVQVTTNEIVITSDRELFEELTELLRFSPDHVGLTDENLDRLATMIKRKYIQYVKNELQINA
jgi:hypothetical protein